MLLLLFISCLNSIIFSIFPSVLITDDAEYDCWINFSIPQSDNKIKCCYRAQTNVNFGGFFPAQKIQVPTVGPPLNMDAVFICRERVCLHSCLCCPLLPLFGGHFLFDTCIFMSLILCPDERFFHFCWKEVLLVESRELPLVVSAYNALFSI